MPKADSAYTTTTSDWRPPDPWLPRERRRRIIYWWLRKACNWKASFAWKAADRWTEELAQ